MPENYIQRAIQLAHQGFTRSSFQEYDTDWDSEAYHTVAGPELEQLASGSPTSSSSALAEDGDWQLTGGPTAKVASKTSRRASSGTRSRTPHGTAPIPGCSTTRPSTSGTPARPTGASTPRNPCVTGDTLVATQRLAAHRRPPWRGSRGGRRRRPIASGPPAFLTGRKPVYPADARRAGYRGQADRRSPRPHGESRRRSGVRTPPGRRLVLAAAAASATSVLVTIDVARVPRPAARRRLHLRTTRKRPCHWSRSHPRRPRSPATCTPI